MNFKDRIIRKLLEFGKKNRLFVYPTLVIVAIITAISHAVKWGKSSGKKLVASIVILSLLISQSLFIKSSAELDNNDNIGTATDAGFEEQPDTEENITPEYNYGDDGNEAMEGGNEDDETTEDSNADNSTTTEDTAENGEEKKDTNPQESYGETKKFGITGAETVDPDDSETINVNYYFVYDNNEPKLVLTETPTSISDTSITIRVPDEAELASIGLGDASYKEYFTFTNLCIDEDCSIPITDAEMGKNDTGEYNVYYTVTRTKYPILIDDITDDTLDKSSLFNISPVEGEVFPSFTYPVGDATTYNAYKLGYEYKGLSYGEGTYSSGNDILVQPSDFNPVTFTYEWTPYEMQLVFDAKGADDSQIEITGAEEKNKTVKFDENVTMFSDTDMEGWAGKEGYYLAGWTDGTNTYVPGAEVSVKDLVEPTGNITDSPNVTCKKLTAIWEYKNIQLSAQSENCVAEVSDFGMSISGVYGEEISCEISANYKSDSTQGNKFSYYIDNAEISKLGTYGLSFTTTSNGDRFTSCTISGKVNNVTTSDVSINLQVTDDNKPDEKISNHTILLRFAKRPITLDGSTVMNSTGNVKPAKVFDGSDEISVKETAAVSGLIEDDEVIASFDQIAILDSSNAGKRKSLTLKNVVLDGEDKDKYYLNDYDPDGTSITINEIAEVTRKSVSIEMALRQGESDSILFGQETPKYALSVVNSDELVNNDKNAYDSAVSDEAREEFFTTYLGFTGWDCQRALYSPAGSYIVKPTFNDANSNYTVSTSEINATFVVEREAGQEGVNYKFDREMVNNYYPGLVILPSGKYNKIRLIDSNSKEITPSMSREEVEGMFSNSITIPDMTDGSISFEMMGTSEGKGAVTAVVTLQHMNVDNNPPEYVSHMVSPNSNFFKQYDFGSYYHKHNIGGTEVESVTITFTYKSKDSACDKLYYFFADESGRPKGDTNRETTMTRNAMGDYEGTIIIGTGVSGQLIVYASDKTGNVSVKSRIKMSDIEDFLENDGKYYEWMVENTINSAEIVAYGTDGNQAASTPVWNNGVVFKVEATDADSGLNKVKWSITNPDGSVTSKIENAGAELSLVKNMTSYGKILEYDFTYNILDAESAAGEYYVEGILYDNADNSAALDKIGPFLIDCKSPVIEYDEPDNTGYQSNVKFDFNVTEGENESGISSVKVYKDSIGEESCVGNFGAEGSYSIDVDSNATYYIVAEDIAGNTSERSVTFSGISDVLPDAPVIEIDPDSGKLGNDGWYIENNPKAIIRSKTTTSDNVPVTTHYKIVTPKKEIEKTADNENYSFIINEKGNVTIEAWSVSASGCKSEVVTADIKIDVEAPEVYMTESSTDENGKLYVNFKATDNVSGVDTSAVTVNGAAVTVEESEGVVSGRFIVEDNTTYEITVKDKAGNVSEVVAFTPLGMSVSPVMDITDKTAFIAADVYVGTYPIADSYIACRPVGGVYDTCLAKKTDTAYGLKMEYAFKDLKPDTEYEYRIYAMTKDSKETKVVEGKFKTTKTGAKGNVYGKVTYDENLSDTFKTYPIYVNLYSGNTIIAGEKIDDEADNLYKFENIADGSYRVVATNGLLTKESSVAIEKGGITYPKNYAANDGINFVLSGLSTRVVIEDGAICLTADGLDKIYNTELYNGNVSNADLEVVAQGGTIDIALYASYIDVSNVSSTVQTVLKDNVGEQAEIKKYIQLYIVKTVKDSNGNCVNGSPSNITRLAEKITVAFPLGELAGQKIYVASLHGDSSGYVFANWNGDSDISISTDYVTISTDRFSVYALYKLNVIPKEYTVKWIDGNGKVLKVEKVTEGEKATPPNVIPTKASSDKYYYEFVGWDTEYSSIKKDTIIAAKFTAHKKKSDKPQNTTEDKKTTEENKDNKKPEVTTEGSTPDGITPDGITPSTKPNDNGNKIPNKTTPTQKNDAGGKKDSPATYTYMGSADSPRTGDATPVEVMVSLMLLAGIGIVVIRRKNEKTNE